MRERSPPLTKIMHPSRPVWAIASFNAAKCNAGSPPGGTACLITVSPVPGKLSETPQGSLMYGAQWLDSCGSELIIIIAAHADPNTYTWCARARARATNAHYMEYRANAVYRVPIPCKRTMASVMLVGEGGSRALLRNSGTSPSRRSLMVRAISCKGVRSISGVICRGMLRRGQIKIQSRYKTRIIIYLQPQ